MLKSNYKISPPIRCVSRIQKLENLHTSLPWLLSFPSPVSFPPTRTPKNLHRPYCQFKGNLKLLRPNPSSIFALSTRIKAANGASRRLPMIVVSRADGSLNVQTVVAKGFLEILGDGELGVKLRSICLSCATLKRSSKHPSAL